MPSFLTMMFIASLAFNPADSLDENGTLPSLINGNLTDRDLFPEAVYVFNSHGSRCSATVIGPRVVLTAAHCIDAAGWIASWLRDDPVQVEAQCEQSNLYSTGIEDHDMALCLSPSDIHLQPATIASLDVRVGDKVLLSGYGCTSYPGSPEGGNDGSFRTGVSTVISLPHPGDWFYTRAQAALCSGDSGGAAYIIPKSGDVTHGPHQVVGVNSRGNMHDLSLLTDLTIPQSKAFFHNFIAKTGATICGVNLECTPPTSSPTCHLRHRHSKKCHRG